MFFVFGFYSLMSFERSSLGVLWKVLDFKRFLKQFMEKIQWPIRFLEEPFPWYFGIISLSKQLFRWHLSSIYCQKQQLVLMKRLYWGNWRSKFFECEIFNNWCCSHTHDPTFFIIVWRFEAFFDVFMTSSVGTNDNGPKPTRTGNLQITVTFGENSRSCIYVCIYFAIIKKSKCKNLQYLLKWKKIK